MTIQWLEWEEEAFEKARLENKPVLLDIHGVWCHWCHQMDKSYEDDLVIELVNEKFVPIKVDTDKRPDINERYNQGGWPTTAFLTPDGMIIAGTTYLPPGQLAIMLEQVSSYFQRNNDIQFDIQKPEVVRGEVKSATDFLVDEMMISFDTAYGGFGSQPKFPLPDVIEAALLKFRQTNDKSILSLATKTLDGMMGIFDSVEGGFFRYSVNREWNLPHYEKMLETNAHLIAVYFNTCLLTGEDKYKEIAERTADFLITMSGVDGFYGSQDADKEEEYYGKPLEERRKMPQPFMDKNIYVNLNALAISALLKLGGKYREKALAVLENLWMKCFEPGKGMCHYYDGQQHVFGLLADNVNFTRCLLDAYEKTADGKYLQLAKQLMDFTVENFFNDGFVDRTGDGIGLLKTESKNINENAVAAGCLIRLSFYLGEEKYRKLAEEALSVFTNYGQYRLHAASYALAVERFLNPIEITAKSIDFINGMPHDYRIMIKFDDSIPDNLMICLSGTCMKFNSAEEASRRLLVMR